MLELLQNCYESNYFVFKITCEWCKINIVRFIMRSIFIPILFDVNNIDIFSIHLVKLEKV
jgi:hypothetical protein